MRRPARSLRGYRLTTAGLLYPAELPGPVLRPEVEASLLDALCRSAHRAGGYVDGARLVVRQNSDDGEGGDSPAASPTLLPRGVETSGRFTGREP